MTDQKIIHPLQIGNVTVKNNLVLGPMAGVTDLPFRLLCKEMGVGLLVSEMVSAKAITYKNKNTRELLVTRPEEAPISLQLFGNDPSDFAEAMRMVEEEPFQLVDVNMGCPVPKVVNNGEGSALMQNPKLVEKIVSALVHATEKPVTVKIRAGFHEGERQAVEVAKAAEAGGASAVAVHGRTRDQYYGGNADWTIIRDVKDAVSIPVIGNGDINGGSDVVRMVSETGCDGVMVARAARGNPWIFREILEYCEKVEPTESIEKTDAKLLDATIYKPSMPEMAEMMLRHARLLVEVKGEFTAIHEMRKHAAWYTAGYRHASHFRGRVNHCETYVELEDLVQELLKTYVEP